MDLRVRKVPRCSGLTFGAPGSFSATAEIVVGILLVVVIVAALFV